MTNQIINTRLEAICFAHDRGFNVKEYRARASTIVYECGQVEFEIGHGWCAYYVKSKSRQTRKVDRLIWGCRWHA